MDEILPFSAEDLSVLPPEFENEDYIRTPAEVKKVLNPAGLKHLLSLIRETMLLKVDKQVDQAWHLTNSGSSPIPYGSGNITADGGVINYTTKVENFGNTFYVDIIPKMEVDNPLPDSVITHIQLLMDANTHWHMDATTPIHETHIRSDFIQGKLQFITKDRRDDTHTSTEMSNDGNPETIANMDYDSDHLYLAPSSRNSPIKTKNYQDIKALSLDHITRIIVDGTNGRAYYLSSKDPIEYINELSRRIDGQFEPLAREPETIARIVDIPVHIQDLESFIPTLPFSGSKAMDDMNFDFYLPYTSGYTGVENREQATVDDLYTRKNDFNWFWNHYINKQKYIDFDRNNIWTGINRIRNTGNYLGWVWSYRALESIGAPQSGIPRTGWSTTWGALRGILNCDTNRMASDNDIFIVQHNNDSQVYTYKQTSDPAAVTQPGLPPTPVGGRANGVDLRLNFQAIKGNGILVQTESTNNGDHGMGGANSVSPSAINTSALRAYISANFYDNEDPPSITVQNTIDNYVYNINSSNPSGQTYPETSAADGVIKGTPSSPLWSQYSTDGYSQQPDMYTFRSRIYRIIVNDVNKYGKTSYEGMANSTPITIYPEAWLDQYARNFTDTRMPLGRGQIKTQELEDHSVSYHKLEPIVQQWLKTQCRLVVYSSSNPQPPNVTLINHRIYDWRESARSEERTQGWNVAYNSYTRVMWVCKKGDGNDGNESQLANEGVGTWWPCAGTIFP